MVLLHVVDAQTCKVAVPAFSDTVTSVIDKAGIVITVTTMVLVLSQVVQFVRRVARRK